MNPIEKELAETQEALRRSRNLLASAEELIERLSKREFSKVTRVEVIWKEWREYVNIETHSIQLSLQDEWRTMKLFIN